MNRLSYLVYFCITLVAGGGFVNRSEAAEDGHADALRIVVKPAKTKVRVMETFKVSLRVENATPVVQQIRVMNCSWDQHWKVSNPQISWLRWPCRKNSPVTLDLAPGGAYARELEMLVPGRSPKRQ
jgi:hypothetical protein